LKHLFAQCQSRWLDYQGPDGFGLWLTDSVFAFFALNARALGLNVERYTGGSFSGNPLLQTLLQRAVYELICGNADRPSRAGV
ncbi:MAG: hypothetical protein AB1700_11275, partial [Bacillota bacterium]